MTEPNNIIRDADDSGLIPGEASSVILNGEIGQDEDVDLYQFEANAGEALILDLDAAEIDSTLDAGLRLFDSDGRELDNNDDRPAPGEELGVDPSIIFLPEKTGTYYLGVSSFANLNYDPINGDSTANLVISENATGAYQLELDTVPDTVVIDPDSNLKGAIFTGLNTSEPVVTLEDVIEASSDVDIYQVSLGAGENLILGLDILNSSSIAKAGLGLRLFDDSGRGLKLVGNLDPERVEPDEALSFTAQNAGDYFVGVAQVGNSDYDPVDGTPPESSDLAGIVYQLNLSIVSSADIVDTATNDLDSSDEVFENFTVIEASRKGDSIAGNAESTFIDGLGGHDSITGADSNDYFLGNNGNDILSGNKGNDTLIGGRGADFLSGGNGADFLQGDQGSNVLLGGRGADIFVITEHVNAYNTISDFEVGRDKILLDTTSSFDNILIEDVENGSGVIISAPNGKGITQIPNVSASDLSKSSFI